MLYGIERAPTTGLQHLQGFCIFHNARTLKQAIAIFNPYHVEICKGNITQNITYVSKEGNTFELGVRPEGSGKRNDIEIVKEMFAEGKHLPAIIMEVNSYQAVKFAEMMYIHCSAKRTWKPTVKWFWGTPGSGKTRAAYESFRGLSEPYKTSNLKWWQGYNGQEHVILDDIRPHSCPFNDLLGILDRYEWVVECKGSSRQLLAKVIIITTVITPASFCPSNEDSRQLIRRIDEIRQFNTDTEVGAGNTVPPLTISNELNGFVPINQATYEW